MARTTLNIGLFGFGCVGEGLFQVLEISPSLQTNIKKICIKHPDKKRSIDSNYFTTAAEEVLNDPEINVIVELIDDSEAAFEIVSRALRSGKPVVSANKKMLAEHFSELHQLQKETGQQILYEAACCASIPLIRSLEEYYDNDLLGGLEGIVNGSTNFILSKMESENCPFETALKEAQEAGYAERNPALDIEGTDARNKLLLLIVHGFGKVLRPDQIFYMGITQIAPPEQDYAKEKGFHLKLLARCGKLANGKLFAYVLPALVPNDSLLAKVEGVYNGVNIESSFSESQFFSGKGAGAFPTASAVLSDLSALSYNYRYEYRKEGQELELAKDHEVFLRIYYRTKGDMSRHALFFTKVEQVFSCRDRSYLVGIISLKNLKFLAAKNKDASVLFIDHVHWTAERHRTDLSVLTETNSLML